MIVQVAVTTTQDLPELITKAQEYADELAVPFIPRQRQSLEKIRENLQLTYLIVLDANKQITLKGENTFFWHPNMAVPRLKVLRSGQKDSMVEAMALKEGYRVLDCTLGLGADALVAAYAVGQTGHVIGLEANKFTAFITAHGLKNFNGQNTHIKSLVDRITVVPMSYQDYLANLPANSFDVVYFDPMFRRGFQRSSAMNALRPLANHEPLELKYVKEALRVARSRVVLKQDCRSQEFANLGVEMVLGGKYSSIAYGVWQKK